MNSAVKQYPRPLSGLTGLWALLSSLLVAVLPAFGQGSAVIQSGSIRINDAQFVAGNTIPAKATPYPSSLVISNQFVGVIQKAAVVLPGLNHAYANDVDVLLVTPTDEKIVLLSDVALNGIFSGADITVDADAANSFPASLSPGAAVAGGSYKPANFAPDDVFPDSVTGPFTGNLTNLAGLSPMGTWRLFVMDDKFEHEGTINGWQLKLWTSPIFGAVTNSVRTLENLNVSFPVEFNDTDNTPESVVVKVVATDKNLVSDTNIIVSATGRTRTVTITPNLNRNGTTPLTITVNDGRTTISSNITLTIGAVNQPPTIVLNTNRVETSAGGFSATAIATVGDVDAASLDEISVYATTSNGLIVPTNFVVDVTRVGAARSLVVAPLGTATGTVDLQIFSRDAGTSNNVSSAAALAITINPITQALFSYPSNLVIPDDNSLVTQTVGVSNVFGAIGKITASLNGITHPNPADLQIRLKSPGGAQEALLLSGNGGDTDVIGTWITLDDASTNATPSVLNPGTYRPNQPLSAFNNISANGNWTLEVRDTVSGPLGAASIRGGVTLKFFTAPEVRGLINTNLAESTSKQINFTVADFDGQVTNIVATTGPDSLLTASVIQSGNNAVLTLTGKPDQNGTASVTVTARDTSGFTGSTTISVVVNPVNTVPNISPVAKQLTYAGVPLGPIDFTVDDTGPSGTAVDETPAGNIVLIATSNNQKLVPDGNIILGGSGGTRNFTIYPIGNQEGTVSITLKATDAGIPTPAKSMEIVFIFQVLPPASPLVPNLAPIVIADSGPGNGATNAAPYPSTIQVANQSGLIRQIQVTLVGVQHPLPQDLGVLLVGPNNEQVVLASGAGGNNAIRDVQLIFSDSASGALPTGSLITSGSYRASNLNGRLALDFPGTGSTRPLSANLSIFNGVVPNGNWSLYVRDFTGNSKGDGQQFAGGWMISFITEANLAAIPNQETLEDTVKRVGITIGDNQPGIAVTLTAISDRPDIVTNSPANLRFEPGNVAAASQVLVITPGNNKFGDVNITVTATVGTGTPSSRTFLLKVLPVNDDPVIAGVGSNDRTKPAGLIDGPRIVMVRDQESNANDIGLTASSSNKDLIPDSNIILTDLNDGNGNWEITVVPNGVLTGETTITLSAKVGNEKPGSKSFKYTVTRNRSFVSEEGRIEIRDNSTASPYPSVVRVSNVQGVVSKLSVTLLGLTHSFPDDADLLLVSPDGTRSVVLLSDAGGGAPTNSIANVTLTIDDDGSELTSEAKLGYRTYKPGNFGVGVFPPPAPSSGYTSTLTRFNGISPNGDWKLYALDDTFSDFGAIERGWILVIETAPSISAIGAQVTREDTKLDVVFDVADADTDAQNLRTWALSSNESLVNNTNLITGPINAFSRTLSLTPSLNQNGTNIITVFVADNRVTNSTSFALTVTAVDDPPLMLTSTNLVRINEDTQTNIVFRVSDVDSVLSVTNAAIESANITLVPNSTNNLTLAGSVSIAVGETNEIIATVKPAANQFGEALLTFTMRDGTTPVTRIVTLVVTAVNDAPSISVTNNAYTVNAGATLANIPVTVGDVETPARNLVVWATSNNTGLLPTNNIVLGGANESRLLSVTPIGAATGTAVITLRVRDEANAESTTNITITVNAAPGKSFANTAPITVRDNNSANPYGSPIIVPALEGMVSQVIVTLDGLTHSSPDDIDVLLVSPSGSRKVVILSDAGGNIPISNGRIILDDAAGEQIPDNGPVLPGTYKPSNYGEVDTFPSPAPVAPYASTLADFNGIDPEGTWTLYVLDDTLNDAGSIAGGWSLKIVTTPRIVTTTASPVVWDEDTTAIINFEVNDLDAGSKLDQLQLFTISSNPSLLPNGNVTFTRVSGDPNSLGGPWNYQALLLPTTNTWGANLLTIGVRRLSDRATASIVLANTVRVVNDAPVISRVTEKTTDENQSLTVSFLVTDVDTDPKDLSIRADSANDGLISDSRVLFFGQTNFLNALASAELSLSLSPNTNQTGTALITLTVTDNSTNPPPQTATSSFNLRVLPFNDPPTIRAITDIAIPSGSNSTNIAFGVDDNDSATVRVTATSSDETLVRNSSIRIFRDQAGTLPAEDLFAPGNRWIRVTSEVGKRGSATITVTATDGAKTSTRTFVVNVVESRERGFVNNRSIVIRDNSSADPYPSVITVASTDLAGDVSQVRVRLSGFAHGFPSDVDVLLVSPNGRSVMLMSDAGGGSSVTNITLTFNDGASEEVPAAPPLSSREYRPRNYDPQADAFPTPAPAAPFGTTLGSLTGTPAAGDWKLYVVDDTASDSGFINGGWELFITSQPRIVGLADITIKEDQEFSLPFTIVEEGFAESSFTFTTTTTNAAVIRTNDLVFRGSGTTWTISGKPVDNVSGASRITVSARNAYAQVVSSAFTVTVTTENDQPFITPVSNLTIASGTASAPVAFAYGDAETPQKDLTFTVTSSNQELVPTNNVFVVGGFLTIAPVGNLSGRSEITLTVVDPTGLTDSTSFTVTVSPSANAQFSNPAAITIPSQGKASLYPSTLEVSRVRGTVARVTVTLAQINHPYPSDMDVLLVGPQGQKVVLMSDAGGSERLRNVRYTFDDRAAAGLPINPSSPVPTGTYKPTNHQGVDDFPDAPAGAITATLDVFNGTSPNGTWSLYVVDDASPDGGNISGGWILSIFTTDPTISAIDDQITNENMPITVAFRVEDADTAATNLVVAASSDSPRLLTLALSGTGNDRTLRITPTQFASGPGIVTIGVTDGQTLTETSFSVTVNPVNQAPVISGLSDKLVPSNVTLQAPFTVFDQETAASNLVVSATISRAQFGTVEVTGVDTNRTLVFRSSGDQGQAFISVRADDGTTNTTQVISVTVGPPYELVVSAIADQNMVESESARTVAFTVTGSTSGNLTITGESDNSTLVNRVGISGTGENRNATITLNPAQSGESMITITATDDLGGVGTIVFKLTVVRGNRPPVLAPIPPQTTRPNVPLIVPLVVTDEDTPSTQWVFTSSITDTTIIRNVVFGLNSTGGFVATVNLVRDAVGTTTITVNVSDGVNRVSQAFPITVAENPPTLGSIADQTTVSNQPIEIMLAVRDLDTPITELVYSATSSNPSLIAGVTFDTSGGTVKATINLVTDATGVATVTISVKDSINTVSQVFAVQVNTAAAPEFATPTITTNPDGSKTITVTWDNGGELESAVSAVGPWTATGNTTGTYSEPATAGVKLFRIKR